MTDVTIDAIRHQGMVLANFQRRRPIRFQVQVSAREDQQSTGQEKDTEPPQPGGQTVIRKIQPVGDGIDQGEKNTRHREQAQQNFFGGRYTPIGFGGGFPSFPQWSTNSHLDNYSNPIEDFK